VTFSYRLTYKDDCIQADFQSDRSIKACLKSRRVKNHGRLADVGTTRTLRWEHLHLLGLMVKYLQFNYTRRAQIIALTAGNANNTQQYYEHYSAWNLNYKLSHF